MISYYNSVAGGSGPIADFDIWYEAHRLTFWGWMFVAIVVVFVMVRRKK